MPKADPGRTTPAPKSADRPSLRDPVRLSPKAKKALDVAAKSATPYSRTKRATA